MTSLRFLGFAVLTWAGVRAASLALAPGTTTPLAPTASPAELPAVAQTRFDPPPPLDPLPSQTYYPGQMPGYGPAYARGYPPPYPPIYSYPRGDRTIVIPASWPVGPPARRQTGDG